MQQSSRNTSPVRIALVGDFSDTVIAHRAIPLALDLSAQALNTSVTATWLHTAALARDGVERSLDGHSAIWCVPASPYESMDAALAAIRFARESGRPFLGTCGGFQHAVIEYARNVLGLADADHAETNPHALRPLIAPLTCPLVERPGALRLRTGSRLRAIYGLDQAQETYHCSYGVNPQLAHMLEGAPGLRVSATDDAGEIRAIELLTHPFFIATLFQPERSALRGIPHPLITQFLSAATRQHDRH